MAGTHCGPEKVYLMLWVRRGGQNTVGVSFHLKHPLAITRKDVADEMIYAKAVQSMWR